VENKEAKMRNISKLHMTSIALFWVAGFALAVAFALMPNFNFFQGNMDKLGHMGAFGFLMIWPALLLREARTIAIAAVTLFFLGIGIEWAQVYIPRRSPEIMDVVFNTMGLALGLSIATLINQFKKVLFPAAA